MPRKADDGVREYEPPEGFVEMARRRTAFLLSPWTMFRSGYDLTLLLVQAYVQGLIDCDQLYEQRHIGPIQVEGNDVY